MNDQTEHDEGHTGETPKNAFIVHPITQDQKKAILKELPAEVTILDARHAPHGEQVFSADMKDLGKKGIDWPAAADAPDAPDEVNLDDMTKDQFVAHANEHGIDLDGADTKAEIRAAIDDHTE